MDHNTAQGQIMDCLERMRKIRFWQSPNGMSPGECKLLGLICRMEQDGGAAAVSELCRETGLKSASVSRTMNALEQKGMIERSIDPESRRNVLVRSTSLGKRTDLEQQQEMCRFWNDVFSRLPEKDITMLVRIWNEVLDGMEAVVRERSEGRG